ncbi:MAG TPA: hypothetical protein VF292_08520 [Rhodanobacteraceae bacterium]
MNKKILAVLIAGTFALGGCASMVKTSRIDNAHFTAAQSAVNKAMTKAQATPKNTLVTIQNFPYASLVKAPVAHDYPATFQKSVQLSATREPVQALLGTLGQLSGYTVTAGGAVLRGSVASPTTSHSPFKGTAPAVAMGGNAPGGTVMAPALTYTGTLEGLLNHVGTALDATWKYNAAADTVHFYRYETKVFQIATVPGSEKNDATFAQQTNTVTGGQGQSVNVNGSIGKLDYTSNASLWKTLDANVKPLLSPTGSFTLSEPTSTVTVHDTWTHVAMVAKYVKRINRSLTTQVRVNVIVYQVDETRGDERAFSLSALYNSVAKRAGVWGLDISTPPSTSQGLGSFTLTAPQDKNGTGGLATNQFAGSKAFLQMLDSVGHASILTQGGIVTVNNIAAPFQSFNSQGYLAEATSLFGDGIGGGSTAVGAGATLMPGTVNTGFSMSVLPSVQPDGHRVLLQMDITLSTLNSLLPVTSGGEEIQVPNVSGNKLMPRAWLRSGQTLILADFQTKKADRAISSPFGSHTWFLSGDRDVTTSRDAIVICITPIVTAQQNAI